MKRYVLLILFLVLTLFQLFQIVNLNKNVTDLSASEQMLYRHNKLLEREIEDNEKIAKMQHWFEGKQMEDMVLADFYDKDTVSLNSLLSIKRSFFLFISEKSCTTCYLPYLKQVNSLARKQGFDRVFLLADYENRIGLKSLLLEHNIRMRVYSVIKTDKLLEHNIEPISFLLTLNRYIDNVFIPYMTNSSQVESYLNIVEERLFNN